jgi:hypothetical protein
MSRQIKAKTLIVKQLSPAPLTSTGKRRISCPRCKKTNGANRKAQNIKELRVKMQRRGYILQSNSNAGVVDDSLLILASLGIGVVTETPIQPNPRSEEKNTAPLKADFSLLQIETDQTKIPNVNIFDRKSATLKKGTKSFVRADQIMPFNENSSFFKIDEFATPKHVEQRNRQALILQRRNLSGLVSQLIKQQTRAPNRLMEPHFKKAMGKGE